jgi:hypothetical protein
MRDKRRKKGRKDTDRRMFNFLEFRQFGKEFGPDTKGRKERKKRYCEREAKDEGQGYDPVCLLLFEIYTCNCE